MHAVVYSKYRDLWVQTVWLEQLDDELFEYPSAHQDIKPLCLMKVKKKKKEITCHSRG